MISLETWNIEYLDWVTFDDGYEPKPLFGYVTKITRSRSRLGGGSYLTFRVKVEKFDDDYYDVDELDILQITKAAENE